MELKPLSYYYSEKLKNSLRDGDNKYIKDYTTYGFKKSYQMWNDYSHASIESFFNDFMKDYSEEFLKENCRKCLSKMNSSGSTISYDILFDILLRRLVIDAFIGFKAEDIIKEKFINGGYKIHNSNILSKSSEIKLDTNYGIDILIFNENSVSTFVQVKNTSTFAYNGNYIKEKRKEFFEKERKANEFIGDGKNRKIHFYIYDKNAFIQGKQFKYFINPRTDKCYFTLNELIENDGTLKLNIHKLKSREL